MKFTTILMLVLTGVATVASGADASNEVPRGQGYFVQGLGVSTPDSYGLGHTVGGGEGAIVKGFGVGAEIGALYQLRDTSYTIGQFSVGGNYHFLVGRQTKWDPFVNGGYTLLFRSGFANGFHYGGGLTYWFSRHIGFRAEFRAIQASCDCGGMPTARFGLSFR